MSNIDQEHVVRNELFADLTERASKSRRHAQANDRFAALCYSIAVAATIAATLGALVEQLPRPALAAISSAAGFALVVLNVFAFDKKAAWHRRRKRMYEDLSERLRFEGARTAEISGERRALEKQMQDEYPGFGALADPKARVAVDT